MAAFPATYTPPVPVSRTMVAAACSGSSSDPAVFDEPERLVIDRFPHDAFWQSTPETGILPFSAGVCHCTGSLPAQMEMKAVMSELPDRLELAESVPEDPGDVLQGPGIVRARLTSLVPS